MDNQSSNLGCDYTTVVGLGSCHFYSHWRQTNFSETRKNVESWTCSGGIEDERVWYDFLGNLLFSISKEVSEQAFHRSFAISIYVDLLMPNRWYTCTPYIRLDSDICTSLANNTASVSFCQRILVSQFDPFMVQVTNSVRFVLFTYSNIYYKEFFYNQSNVRIRFEDIRGLM